MVYCVPLLREFRVNSSDEGSNPSLAAIFYGEVAQLGERLPCTHQVANSIFAFSTNLLVHIGNKGIGAVVQPVRMLACHARGRGFKSRPLRHTIWSTKFIGLLAHQVEHSAFNRVAAGSRPARPTNFVQA